LLNFPVRVPTAVFYGNPQRASALAEAGDVVIPLRQGVIAAADLVEIGEVVARLCRGAPGPTLTRSPFSRALELRFRI
jgi:hypothetical protein